MKSKLIIYGIFLFAMITACKEDVVEETKVIAQEEMEENAQPEPSAYSSYGVDMLLGQFEPDQHVDYVLIDVQYADRAGMFIHKDTYAAYKQMRDAAKEEGINLTIRSATRNFNYQKGIWERKWTGETKIDGQDISKTIIDAKTRALKILEYSSMPGTSRHHWGSDIDLNSFDNDWFEKGEGKIMWDWLEGNAAKFGFCRPYTAKDEQRPDGYYEERWHWSYMPLARYFTDLARSEHNNDRISGFMGAEVANEINVVEKYVFGINKDCL